MNLEPHLEIIIGTMFSGKSTELIKLVNRYEVTGKRVQLFKPALDIRYSQNHVSSHDGLKKEVTYVTDLADLKAKYDPAREILGIDEPQFLESGIVDFTEEHVQRGGIAVVSLLLKDFRDDYFKFKDEKGDVSEFIRRADQVIYLTALCTFERGSGPCGKEASRVQRFVDGKIAAPDSDRVLVGGKEAYEPRCRQHYQFYR